MPPVLIYSSMLCPYCMSAKRLLTRKGVNYEEIDVTARPGLRSEMREKAGGRNTVPQIWIGDIHVGGCDDLYELENTGKLDELLAKPE